MSEIIYGPQTKLGQEKHKEKYRIRGESFKECCSRVAAALTDSEEEFYSLREVLLNQRFLPGGRIQSSIGSPKETTALNCFINGVIEDSMSGIMEAASKAATTMRLGGGIGNNFSTIRPKGARIKKLDANSSGAVSFMGIFDSVCGTIRSAGNRRGAMGGYMIVSHPDIEEFISIKQNEDKLTNFNLSVIITDEFMNAIKNDSDFNLTFNGVVYDTVRARYLWDKIMRSTWDWGEPGIIFIDQMNRMNNLWYCEEIIATNP